MKSRDNNSGINIGQNSGNPAGSMQVILSDEGVAVAGTMALCGHVNDLGGNRRVATVSRSRQALGSCRRVVRNQRNSLVVNGLVP